VVELIHAVHIQKQVLATKATMTLSRLHSRKAGKGSPPPQQKNKNARLRDIAAREQHAMHKSLFTQPRLLFILETARAHRNQKPGPQFPNKWEFKSKSKQRRAVWLDTVVSCQRACNAKAITRQAGELQERAHSGMQLL
jgi:hypothetical protein